MTLRHPLTPLIFALILFLSVGCSKPTLTRPNGMRILFLSGENEGYPDQDGDGYDVIEDCNDFDPSIYPGAFESVNDTTDRNCDGYILTDRDGDGYADDVDHCPDTYNPFWLGNPDSDGDKVGDFCDSDADGDGYENGPDCNDSNFTVNPGAPEIPGNGIDDNCDGRMDEQESHCSTHITPYNYYVSNCHSAANAGAVSNPFSTGIIVCGGAPDNSWEPDIGNHTFNYVLNPDGTTTYHNWSGSCGPCVGPASDENIDSAGCHQDCVKKFCGNQWDGGKDERCLSPGQLVQVPSYDEAKLLAIQWAGQTGMSAEDVRNNCYDRCNYIASAWQNATPAECIQEPSPEIFRTNCRYYCDTITEADVLGFNPPPFERIPIDVEVDDPGSHPFFNPIGGPNGPDPDPNVDNSATPSSGDSAPTDNSGATQAPPTIEQGVHCYNEGHTLHVEPGGRVVLDDAYWNQELGFHGYISGILVDRHIELITGTAGEGIVEQDTSIRWNWGEVWYPLSCEEAP